MKIKYRKPEIYDTIKKYFDIRWEHGIVITYGDTVYHHPKFSLPPEKIIHEQVHIDQQTAMGAKEWWDKYFVDPTFRLEQELEAYKREANFVRATIKDKNTVTRLIHEMCISLSGVIYGNVVTYSEAKELLK